MSSKHSILLSAAIVVVFALHVSASPSAPCWADSPQAPRAGSACVCTNGAACDAAFPAVPAATGESEGIEVSRYVENVVSCKAGGPASFFDSGAGAVPVGNVPGALLLTLAGFVVVTLTRDRRTWARLAAAVYRLAETGVSLLPRLAGAIAPSSIFGNASVSLSAPVARDIAWRGQAAETGFAGLLRRLSAEPASAITGNSLSIWQMMLAARGVRVAQAAFCVVPGGGHPYRRA